MTDRFDFEETRMVEATELFFAGDYEFRSPEQGALDFRIGEGADGFEGGVGVLEGAIVCRL